MSDLSLPYGITIKSLLGQRRKKSLKNHKNSSISEAMSHKGMMTMTNLIPNLICFSRSIFQLGSSKCRMAPQRHGGNNEQFANGIFSHCLYILFKTNKQINEIRFQIIRTDPFDMAHII